MTELLRQLMESTETLERADCQFWACPGPDEPFQDMATCFVCEQVQKNRVILDRYSQPGE